MTVDCLFVSSVGGDLRPDSLVWWQGEEAVGRSLPLAECAGLVQGRPVALVLPMEIASAFLVSVPTQKARLMRQALPYVVEEMLAEEVEQFHLALGDQRADGRYPVLVVRRAQLAVWLETMDEVGLKVAAIHLDADLLPLEGEQVLFIGDRALLGGECETRLAFPSSEWPQLRLLCQAETYPHEVENPYQLLASGRAGAINLAQGEFASRSDTLNWNVWKPFAMLAGFAVVLLVAFSLIQAMLLKRSGDTYAQSSLSAYQQLFPEDRRIINLKAQFDDHLRQPRSTGEGFIGLLEQASTLIAEAELSLDVLGVDYNRSRGSLAFRVRANDFSTLEKLRARLVGGGLNVQLGSASREEDGVTAQVVVGAST